ncbi:MAG: hypothetical protein QOF57_866 [Frankiaceae bacterium]|jgi:uncharacterized YccA/Bax inhibitor family protein|nr:hypothetical protein [Frankiaceae bacterium]MDQ1727713.1 hypothetical protein [Frankiaceae bacterium]
MSQQNLRSSNPAWRGAGFQTLEPGYGSDVTIASSDARMTMEDVVVHTVGVFLLAAIGAGFGWVAAGNSGGVVGMAGFAAMALSFVIAFGRVTRPALVIAFSLLEGVALGGVSHAFESFHNGIVAQALIGTTIIFLVMLALHRSGRLRATPRMQKIVTATIIGVVALSLVNWLMLAFGGSNGLSIFDTGNHSPLVLLLNVAVLVVASLMFTLDFAYIESAIAAGVPKREAWRASYGLLVAFVWVYIELLQLLARLNSNR